jgi:hypothetical protein
LAQPHFLALLGEGCGRIDEIAVSRSQLGRDQGKREAAHDALAEIYGWFTERFET